MLLGYVLLAAGTAALALAGPVMKPGTKTFPHYLAIRNATRAFQYFGTNQAGAEFGQTKLPGLLNKDYIWPTAEGFDVKSDTHTSKHSH